VREKKKIKKWNSVLAPISILSKFGQIWSKKVVVGLNGLNIKNSKRTWDLLKEAANLNKNRTEIRQREQLQTKQKLLMNSTIFSPVLV